MTGTRRPRWPSPTPLRTVSAAGCTATTKGETSGLAGESRTEATCTAAASGCGVTSEASAQVSRTEKPIPGFSGSGQVGSQAECPEVGCTARLTATADATAGWKGAAQHQHRRGFDLLRRHHRVPGADHRRLHHLRHRPRRGAGGPVRHDRRVGGRGLRQRHRERLRHSDLEQDQHRRGEEDQGTGHRDLRRGRGLPVRDQRLRGGRPDRGLRRVHGHAAAAPAPRPPPSTPGWTATGPTSPSRAPTARPARAVLAWPPARPARPRPARRSPARARAARAPPARTASMPRAPRTA